MFRAVCLNTDYLCIYQHSTYTGPFNLIHLSDLFFLNVKKQVNPLKISSFAGENVVKNTKGASMKIASDREFECFKVLITVITAVSFFYYSK